MRKLTPVTTRIMTTESASRVKAIVVESRPTSTHSREFEM